MEDPIRPDQSPADTLADIETLQALISHKRNELLGAATLKHPSGLMVRPWQKATMVIDRKTGPSVSEISLGEAQLIVQGFRAFFGDIVIAPEGASSK